MPATRRIPNTRPAVRHPASRGRRSRRPRTPIGIAFRVVVAAVLAVVAILAWAAAARHFTHQSNTDRQTFDAILVLGTPADSDGNPSPELLDRVTEAVHEYERGVAPRLIVTGGAAHNKFVEADVMARVANAQGVPLSRIFEERQAQDTLQNACFSNRILSAHGWHSIEVISSPSHLPRASMIFGNLPGSGSGPGAAQLQWRMHAAPENLTPDFVIRGARVLETLKTARYLMWSRWMGSCSS